MRINRAVVMLAGLALSGVAFAGRAAAQAKIAISEQCGRPTPEYSIQLGDHPGHMFRIEQSTCTPQSPVEIAGVALKQAQVTGFSEIDAAQGAGHDQWFHVFTMANGDSIYARSQGKPDFDGARFKSSTAQWTFEGGTGKFQGLKGGGTYTCHPATGGWACEARGEYTLPTS
jgi:hypothetical protein